MTCLLHCLWSAKPLFADREPRVLPVALFVSEDAGGPAAEDAFLDEQFARANRIFEPARISFRISSKTTIPSDHARLDSRSDRDALASFWRRGAICLFVVASLRDVDERERFRMGVHWRRRGQRHRHYVILSRTAAPAVLAHELGHFFGNPHSPTPDNIMSYDRTGEREPFFDDAQLLRIERSLSSYLRSGEIVQVRSR